MNAISRDEAIRKLVRNELDYWKALIQEGETTYLEGLIRDGGPNGFAKLSNDELEKEYSILFDEEVIIITT